MRFWNFNGVRKLVPSCSPFDTLPTIQEKKRPFLPSSWQDFKMANQHYWGLLNIVPSLKHPTCFCCSSYFCSLEIPQKSLGPYKLITWPTHPPSHESEAPLDLTRPVDRNTPSTFADFPLQRRHGPRCPGNEATALKVQVRPFFFGGGGVFSIRLHIVLGKCL